MTAESGAWRSSACPCRAPRERLMGRGARALAQAHASPETREESGVFSAAHLKARNTMDTCAFARRVGRAFPCEVKREGRAFPCEVKREGRAFPCAPSPAVCPRGLSCPPPLGLCSPSCCPPARHSRARHARANHGRAIEQHGEGGPPLASDCPTPGAAKRILKWQSWCKRILET